jgi:hypothetical protein
MREGLVDDEDTGALMSAARGEDLLFAAGALGIDLLRTVGHAPILCK